MDKMMQILDNFEDMVYAMGCDAFTTVWIKTKENIMMQHGELTAICNNLNAALEKSEEKYCALCDKIYLDEGWDPAEEDY